MGDRIDEFLDFAKRTAFEAGRLTLGYFQTDIQPDFKADDSPVTIADRKAEELIRRRIEKRYPRHTIVGEEFGVSEAGASSYCWLIDPIDGTKSFIRGVPLYGVLIGLEIEKRVEVGVAYFPALDEMLSAANGRGCWLNGRRCRVRETDTLSRSIISFTDAAAFKAAGREAAWQALLAASYYSAGWSDAYGHALVASGRLELMLDPLMNPWDCGPFPVILREAGGYFGDWSGRETIHGNEALSTTRRLLSEVLEIIQTET